MTGEIFAQAMEDLDQDFWEVRIQVTMLLDNFSGNKWREDRITLLPKPHVPSYVVCSTSRCWNHLRFEGKVWKAEINLFIG